MGVAFVFLVFGTLVVIGIAAFLAKRRSGRSHSKKFVGLRPGVKSEFPPTEALSGEMSDPRRVDAYLEIDYQDGNGSWTKRFVRVNEFDNNVDGGILIGHCELRGGNRTFRFDRIMKCIDLETGEFVENVKTYLNGIHADPPEMLVKSRSA